MQIAAFMYVCETEAERIRATKGYYSDRGEVVYLCTVLTIFNGQQPTLVLSHRASLYGAIIERLHPPSMSSCQILPAPAPPRI